MENTTLSSLWKWKAQSIFNFLLLTSVCSIILTVNEFFSSIGAILDKIQMMLPFSDIPHFSSDGFLYVGFLLNIIVIVGYYFLINGLKDFAAMQTADSTKSNLKNIRSAFILLLSVYAVNAIFGIVSSLPLIGILYRLAIWILLIVTYRRMKQAYDGLAESPDFSPLAQQGARNNSYAAKCELFMLMVPVAMLFVSLMFFGGSLLGASQSSSFSRGMENVAATIGIYAVICAILTILGVVWAVVSFLWPLLGWYKIKEGGSAKEKQEVIKQELRSVASSQPVETFVAIAPNVVKSEHNNKVPNRDVFICYTYDGSNIGDSDVIIEHLIDTIMERLAAENINYSLNEDIKKEDIVERIEQSRMVLFLSSASSNNSVQVSKEIACADECGKYILPVRIDNSPYNKKIMFRIADAEFIEYYKDPERGIQDIVENVKSYLESLQAEQQHKLDEERKRLEEQQRQEEERSLVNRTIHACEEWRDSFNKLEDERKELLRTISMIGDEELHQKFLDLLGCGKANVGNVVEVEEENLQKENEELQETMTILTTERDNFQQENLKIQQRLKEREEELASLTAQLSNVIQQRNGAYHEIQSLQSQLNDTPFEEPDNRRLHIIYLSVIALLLIIVGAVVFYPKGTASPSFDEQIVDSTKIEDTSSAVMGSHVHDREFVLKNVGACYGSHVHDREFVLKNVGACYYTGHVDNRGLPNGQGVAKFTNGDTYVGLFKSGLFYNGCYTWNEDGDYFEGSFIGNEPDESNGNYYDKDGNKK